jgi:hypothetical protein
MLLSGALYFASAKSRKSRYMMGMLYRLLAIWLLIAVALSGFYAVISSADESAPPAQWQFEESLIVPALIPEDRCVRAVYLDPALKEERGNIRIEWWQPPITDYMARWLDERRRDGRLSLTFCDEEST